MSRPRLLAALAALLALGVLSPAAVRRESAPAALHSASAAARVGVAAPAAGVAEARRDDERVARAVSGREAAHRLLALEGEGTYLAELLAGRDSILTRWPGSSRPVKVWVQTARGADGEPLPHAAQVRRAFEEWGTVGLPVHFAFVRDSAAADVTVAWTERFDEPISGRTRWVHDDAGWILSGSITLALNHSDGEPLDTAAVRALALHEVGHVLGLDHTRDGSNVMAATVRVRGLSSADAATARLLYRLPPGDLR